MRMRKRAIVVPVLLAGLCLLGYNGAGSGQEVPAGSALPQLMPLSGDAEAGAGQDLKRWIEIWNPCRHRIESHPWQIPAKPCIEWSAWPLQAKPWESPHLLAYATCKESLTDESAFYLMQRFTQLAGRKCELEEKVAALRADIQAITVARRTLQRQCNNRIICHTGPSDDDMYVFLEVVARWYSFLTPPKPQSWEPPPQADFEAFIKALQQGGTLLELLHGRLTQLGQAAGELAEQETAILERILEKLCVDVPKPQGRYTVPAFIF